MSAEQELRKRRKIFCGCVGDRTRICGARVMMRLPSRRPVQPRPNPRRRLILLHLEHAASGLDLGVGTPPRKERAQQRLGGAGDTATPFRIGTNRWREVIIVRLGLTQRFGSAGPLQCTYVLFSPDWDQAMRDAMHHERH